MFREKLTKAQAIKSLFDRFDAALRQAGYIVMGGQRADASLTPHPSSERKHQPLVGGFLERPQIVAVRSGLAPSHSAGSDGALRQF
jgi:hypothetical protein